MDKAIVQTPREPPVLEDGEVDLFVRDRVCARCYGFLTKEPAEGRRWEVRCPRCGEAWNFATVSKTYAERLGQRNLEEYLEVRENLRDLFPPRKVPPEQSLKELGY